MTFKSISITWVVPNTARADVMITSSRAYYRFATSDTCEEGDLPCSITDTLFNEITQALNDNGNDLMPTDVRHAITIEYDTATKEYDNSHISLKTYDFIINRISQLGEEFTFVRGFK